MAFGPLVTIYPTNLDTEAYNLFGAPVAAAITDGPNGAFVRHGQFITHGAKSVRLRFSTGSSLVGSHDLQFYLSRGTGNTETLAITDDGATLSHEVASSTRYRTVTYAAPDRIKVVEVNLPPIDSNSEIMSVFVRWSAGGTAQRGEVDVDYAVSDDYVQETQEFGGSGGATEATLALVEGHVSTIDTNVAALVAGNASAPTAGLTTTINTDNSTLLGTIQVGKRYRVTINGTDGLCVVNSAGPASAATDEPWYAYQKFEFVAVATKLYGIKRTAGSSDGQVVVIPLDGGTVA